jgi:hypothetical protein
MLPTIDFLGRPITRLIAGDNPVNGHTYIPELVSKDDLLGYHTEEKVLEAMRDSLRFGYNAWLPLGSDFMLRVIYHHQRQEATPLHLIFQSFAPIDFAVNLRMMADAKPLGIYHRGTDTDGLCEAGQFDILKDRIKMIQDYGIKAGLGTHVPETILRAEDENWGCDFYVPCLHNSRKRGEAAPSAFVTGKPKEIVFYSEDRPLMFAAIRAVAKPCIAFKVFAGGQIFRGLEPSQRPLAAEAALRETYANIKPTDIACVGFFQRDSNQLLENARLAGQVLADYE